jgi:hypothetical protein
VIERERESERERERERERVRVRERERVRVRVILGIETAFFLPLDSKESILLTVKKKE